MWHHIIPEMWGGPESADNGAELCDNCHYFAHVVLDFARRLNRFPTVAELRLVYPRGVSRKVVALAKAGWAGRPVGPVVATLGHFHRTGNPWLV